MNTLQNLHQHSIFCDGKNTPEEVVQEAIAKGFGAIGFSSHCYMPIVKYSMPEDSDEFMTAEEAAESMEAISF